jgi:hypothetical protein
MSVLNTKTAKLIALAESKLDLLGALSDSLARLYDEMPRAEADVLSLLFGAIDEYQHRISLIDEQCNSLLSSLPGGLASALSARPDFPDGNEPEGFREIRALYEKQRAALSEIMQTYGKAVGRAQELSGFYKDKLRETRLRKDAVRRYCPQDARLQGALLNYKEKEVKP